MTAAGLKRDRLASRRHGLCPVNVQAEAAEHETADRDEALKRDIINVEAELSDFARPSTDSHRNRVRIRLTMFNNANIFTPD